MVQVREDVSFGGLWWELLDVELGFMGGRHVAAIGEADVDGVVCGCFVDARGSG